MAPKGARRLPLRLAMELLVELDVAAFERALQQWQSAPREAPAAGAVGVLAKQVEMLASSELALRLGVLLADRPDRGGAPEAAWTRRWKALSPHLESYLIGKGSKLREYVRGIDSRADAYVARRVGAMGA
jgi:hypothetical protein